MDLTSLTGSEEFLLRCHFPKARVRVFLRVGCAAKLNFHPTQGQFALWVGQLVEGKGEGKAPQYNPSHISHRFSVCSTTHTHIRGSGWSVPIAQLHQHQNCLAPIRILAKILEDPQEFVSSPLLSSVLWASDTFLGVKSEREVDY
jgi:hypothetical protein